MWGNIALKAVFKHTVQNAGLKLVTMGAETTNLAITQCLTMTMSGLLTKFCG